VLPSISTCVTAALYGAAVGAVAYGGYKALEAMDQQAYIPLLDSLVGDATNSNKRSIYTPDRSLPRTPDGIPIPDADAPHTQLGTQEGRKHKYPQAREFDEKGNPVRDIDFTDHGRPQDHVNPHEHPYEDNPTGGTPQRGDSQPVENWNY